MLERRFISFLRRNPSTSSKNALLLEDPTHTGDIFEESKQHSSEKVVAEEGKAKTWGRRLVSGTLIFLTGGVALSALDDLSIYHSCSSKALEKASNNKTIIDAIGEPVVRGPWYNASLAVAHQRKSVSCTFPVSGPQGTGIFQLKAVRNGEEKWTSFLRPSDWEILIMEALVHVPGNEEKQQTFRIRVSDDLLLPASNACTDCASQESSCSVEKK